MVTSILATTWLCLGHSFVAYLVFGHPLYDQVGKDDFVFVNVSCLLATSY